MKISEIKERGFSIDNSGRVLDNFGNEYRDEQGCVVFLDNDCQDCRLLRIKEAKDKAVESFNNGDMTGEARDTILLALLDLL